MWEKNSRPYLAVECVTPKLGITSDLMVDAQSRDDFFLPHMFFTELCNIASRFSFNKSLCRLLI